ncbi:MAG: hypothetical protein KDI37_11675 [Xanthomonadales bacterium]|nr:hypothetical protein [Xanthomonadales bacterium]
MQILLAGASTSLQQGRLTINAHSKTGTSINPDPDQGQPRVRLDGPRRTRAGDL